MKYSGDYDEDSLEDDESCPTCGSLPDSPHEQRCWDCRGCGGMYAPGTEQCDWCPDEKLCFQTYNPQR